jgi:phage/plasmid-like protein (TIGR03299 family)
MSANLDTSNGRVNMAFTGDRNDIWHREGTQLQPGMSIEQWATAAGLKWHSESTPVFARLPDGTEIATPWFAGIRSDTRYPLGIHSERYETHQPQDFLEFMFQYVSVDPRFAMDTAGAIDHGKRIWANASYAEDMTIGGDQHRVYLLGCTAFDGTLASTFIASFVRTVCDNTMRANLALRGVPSIKLRHNTKFDADRVGKQLAEVVKTFEAYKAMGDAMAARHVDEMQLKCLFKSVLDIPWDTPVKDVSARKVNQYKALWDAYAQTGRETEPGTAWCALNGVTRWVDHDRDVRGNGAPADTARFTSANFGPGVALKEKAVAFLTDEDLLRAVSDKTASDSDVAGILKQAFRPSKFN